MLILFIVWQCIKTCELSSLVWVNTGKISIWFQQNALMWTTIINIFAWQWLDRTVWMASNQPQLNRKAIVLVLTQNNSFTLWNECFCIVYFLLPRSNYSHTKWNANYTEMIMIDIGAFMGFTEFHLNKIVFGKFSIYFSAFDRHALVYLAA